MLKAGQLIMINEGGGEMYLQLFAVQVDFDIEEEIRNYKPTEKEIDFESRDKMFQHFVDKGLLFPCFWAEAEFQYLTPHDERTLKACTFTYVKEDDSSDEDEEELHEQLP